MSSFPQKTQITIGIENRSNQSYSSKHVTTSNWMEFGVAGYFKMVPKMSIDIGHSLFSRLEPMPVPTFGEGFIKSKAFFVPFRTVFPAFTDFKEQVEHTFSDGTYGLVTSVPYCDNQAFVELFVSKEYSYIVSDPDKADFVLRERTFDGNIYTYEFLSYNFTPLGRRFYKQLCSLGYRIVWDRLHDASDTYHCLLPLFCLVKIYFDWYKNSQYMSTDRDVSVEKWLSLDNDYDWSRFNAQDLDEIVRYITVVSYDNDLYTSAWDNPNGPNYNPAGSGVSIHNIDLDHNSHGYVTTETDDDDNDLLPGSALATGPISQFLLTSLRKVSDWMKRKQIVGARVLDRYLASYGITLQADKLKRCYYLGGSVQDIRFGDVTSTSDTEGAQLGSYAGKGISYGNGGYKFTADEHGLLIIISTIIPKIGYYQGADSLTFALSPLDFWTPEFDNLGVEALPTRSVYVPTDSRKLFDIDFDDPNTFNSKINWDDLVFGFVPRYAQYKVGRDMLTGDFALGSKGTSMKAWNLFRDLDNDVLFGIDKFVHNPNFLNGSSKQYNRIFYPTDDSVDHFNIVHNFNVKVSFPGKPLFDTYEFENEDSTKKISVDIAGPKAN